jgi:DNA replication ATP-dependent helicase Dna2
VLRALREGAGVECEVWLRDVWVETDVRVGDTVHCIGDFASSSLARSHSSPAPAAVGPVCVVDGERGLLVVNPDMLVSGTTIGNSFMCRRKAVLGELYRTSSVASGAALRGVMAHLLFACALREKDFSRERLLAAAEDIAASTLELQYAAYETQAREYLVQLIPNLQQFAARFVEGARLSSLSSSFAPPEATSTGPRGAPALRVSEVLDIEENIWSPMFGVKGKIDASVLCAPAPGEVAIHGPVGGPRGLGGCVLPLELKTGRRGDAAHRAQVILYALLMGDRYGEQVRWALLYYSALSTLERVPVLPSEVRDILLQRNRLARSLGADSAQEMLPPVLGNRVVCERCPEAEKCMVLHRAWEDGSAETSGLGDAFERLTGELQPQHAEFLQQHLAMLEWETGHGAATRRELWTLSAERREALGRCLARMELRSFAALDDSVVYTFVRHGAEGPGACNGSEGEEEGKDEPGARARGGGASKAGRRGAAETGFAPGDIVLVSRDRDARTGRRALLAAAQGVLARVDGDTVEMRVANASGASLLLQREFARGRAEGGDEPTLWRLDKDEFVTSARLMKDNVLSLFLTHSLPGGAASGGAGFGRQAQAQAAATTAQQQEQQQQQQLIRAAARMRRLRSLLVDLDPPSFDAPTPVAELLRRARHCDAATLSALLRDFEALNVDQRTAVERALSARDYALWLGMPGTGKSTAIVFLVRALVALGRSVLLSSYTHSAVDNLLVKLKAAGVRFLRLGRESALEAELAEFSIAAWRRGASRESEAAEGAAAPRARTLAEMEALFAAQAVVATTCLGSGHAIFARRRFDVCVVDEASQITLPACVGPLRFADMFVLVGDHYQLPPLVCSARAREAGLDVSLFRRLSQARPEAVVQLAFQYRMAQPIMELANRFVYSHQLRCGTAAIAEQRLELALPPPRDAPRWLVEALRPERVVLMLDTDCSAAAAAAAGEGAEERVGNGLRNALEARVVATLVGAFTACGLDASEIGVVSPYRAQLRLLRETLDGLPGGARAEALTVDRFQGRDKTCILFSLVRSNRERVVGELLSDWRRINVALTRAKRKLVLVGSVSTLRDSPLLRAFADFLAARDQIVSVANAVTFGGVSQ